MEILTASTITCPECGYSKEEEMPTNACKYFYECENCHTVLKPQPGDCCVFCSYGSVKCPPIQQHSSCC
ncbi:GDCCVxC domain-containing (seleno)protein [Adhaeribacter swui]|uniref:GDCCVxC domain-containing (seleno)protein n=1 Tax=Adhaeribacter swui TaxID=2086471 RepID=UPI001E4CC1B8|nr:GDCCVxC domain-containing (seleno)protein [Adhaeribacter swui]